MNKKLSAVLSVMLILALCLSFTACGTTSSNGKAQAVIYTATSDDALQPAYTESAQEYYKGCEAESLTTLGSGASDKRYIYIVSSDKSVLEREKVEGQNFTVLVYDNGQDNLSVNMLFLMGDGEDCVAKGSVVSGSAQASMTFDVTAEGVTDPAERSAYLFKNVVNEIKKIEGEGEAS